MSSRHAEISRYRRAARWLWPAALLALTPKCVLCLIVYLSVGTALELNGPEWCTASSVSPISWVTWLAWLGLASGLGGLALTTGCRRIRSVAQAGRES